MNLLIIIVALLIAGLVVWKLRSRSAKGIRTKTISVCDIGEVYRQISTQGVETSFAVFIIAPPLWDAKDTVEIQFSVENGRTGLDWILMSETNRREKPWVIQYALRQGIEWQESEMNNWLYLRVEQGDLAGFCSSLIRDLYKVEEVLLKYGGFECR